MSLSFIVVLTEYAGIFHQLHCQQLSDQSLHAGVCATKALEPDNLVLPLRRPVSSTSGLDAR